MGLIRVLDVIKVCKKIYWQGGRNHYFYYFGGSE